MVHRPVCAAIVGAGYIADFHVDAIRALPNATVAAVCDLNLGRARRFAEAKGIPSVYSELGTLLKEQSIDVVHVLTPPHLHVEPIEQALRAGVDVLAEKPLAHSVEHCRSLRNLAEEKGCALGVSHNFLYFPAYRQLIEDLREGRLGRIDQVDIVWNKHLGQLGGTSFSAWMFQDPRNILFEVAPHSFAHCQDLVGELDELQVRAFDEVTLPGNRQFFRRWEMLGLAGTTSVRLRLSFIDGYPEHYVHVRGTNATARVDFERSTYVVSEHSPHLLDVDRYLDVLSSSGAAVRQATGTLAKFVLSKAGVRKAEGSPFGASILNAISAFYETRGGMVDTGVSAEMGEAAISLAERAAAAVPISVPSAPVPKPRKKKAASVAKSPKVLVIGGTGFIGRALVRRLIEQGHQVRVLARNPGEATDLAELGVDLYRGDFTDPDAVRSALGGIEEVFHLARGTGNSWEEYLKYDVEPTRRVAELCLQAGVRRLYYASSIAIYEAGTPGETINEETRPVPSMLRANPYARSKTENERMLLEMHESSKLPVVLFRPGVVLGAGGSPYHWGVAAWPYNSVARLYGDGNHPLPIVLVEDVADAMVRAMDVEGIEGESFNLVSPPVLTANEYLDELEQQAGIRLRRLPTSPVRSYGEAIVKWAVKSLGSRETLLPSYADWRGRTFASTFDASKACARLGWQPTKAREELVAKGIHEPTDAFLS